MKRQILLVVGILTFLSVKSQELINADLKKELDDILFKDQIYREFIDNNTTESRKNEIAKLTNYSREYLDQNIWMLINKTDTENLLKIEKIINENGYPGKSMVGEPTNMAVFYVVQHSPKIDQYYPLIEKAGKEGELPFKYAAMMLDRKLTNEGRPQIYGTQLIERMITNQKTGEKESFTYVLPIEDAKNVNKRRKEAGFETTVEENAKQFGIEYREYTYEELDKIK